MNTLFNHQKWPVVFFVILCVCAMGCQKITNNNNTQLPFLPQYKDSQLVVLRKPGVTAAAMNLKAQNMRDEYAGTVDRKVCQTCDDSLELWSGSAIAAFINSEVASPSTRPRGNPTGEDDTFSYSVNIIVKLPEENQLSFAQHPVDTISKNTDIVTVAVFDTGVDPDVTNNFTNSVPTCKTGGGRGWNFITNDAVTADVFPSKHGTVVSKFIIDQVRANAAGNRVNILPVKIFNANGASDLFSVLCGFSYAQKAGAKIINASFGFYDYGAEPNPVLLKYVEKVLTNNNVLLVAAAGNAFTDDDDYGTTLGLTSLDLRDMDINHFYPGGLAERLPNVYCVTTAFLTPPKVSPTQNHSDQIVDIGTIADFGAPDYSFKHPFAPLSLHFVVKGSSFATPIFTGKLVSWYSDIAGLVGNKADVLRHLKDRGVVFDDVPAFDPYIREGRYVNR
jgi:Subtilase family